jgi:flagellar export protein FliJ
MQGPASSLQTVIRVKNLQMKKSERELALIKTKQKQEQGALQRLEESQESAMSDVFRVTNARARELTTKRDFVESIAGTIKHQEKKLHEIARAEEAKRSQLVEQSKSEHMLQKLESKRQAEEGRRVEKKAQRVIDGLAQRIRS